MMRRIGFGATLAGCVAGMAAAGVPVERTVICPTSLKPFTVTSTTSCTVFGADMVLGPITTCPFATVLPQCPDTGLPVFRQFTLDEVERLRRFEKTEEFAEIRETRSPFYLAWRVERFLGGALEMRFALLRRGLSADRATLDDPDYVDLVIEEAELAIPVLPIETRPMAHALMAFLHLHRGRREAAEEKLAEIDEMVGEEPAEEGLENYVAAIRDCLDDPESVYCNPERPIPRGRPE